MGTGLSSSPLSLTFVDVDYDRECVGPRRKDTTMTQNKDRKEKIRARMAVTGEPYTAAARNLEAPASDDFVQDRRADLDPNADEAEPEPADWHDGPEITAVPGRVLGSDIEDQADALADGARRLTELLSAFAQEPAPRSMDAIAVFRGLSRAAESMAAAAA
jgi:hypothetical protein